MNQQPPHTPRKIEFRGQRIDKKEFVYGDLIHGVGSKKGRMYILPAKENLAYLEGCHHLDGYEVIPETVGQFTGLLDKNGKKIFEGDKVSCQWGAGHDAVVEFKDGGFMRKKINNDYNPFRADHKYEVIGNIHTANI